MVQSWPHGLADGNQHIQTREKMLEFSSTVLSTLFLYLVSYNNIVIIIYIRTKQCPRDKSKVGNIAGSYTV